MIRLVRARTLADVPKVFRGASRVAREQELLQQLHAKDGFTSTYWNARSGHWKAAKNQLKIESFGKCAYCDAPTNSVAHGDVEHIRPKSRYWWLAFCYENYVYACQICNQTYKGDAFPIGGRRLASPVRKAKRSALAIRKLTTALGPDPLDATACDAHHEKMKKEKAHLPDPYTAKVEKLFAWKANAILKEVRVVPRGNSAVTKQVVNAVEAHLGLNREELLRLRWQVFSELEALCATLDEPLRAKTRKKVEAAVRAAVADDAMFAGMARYFVRDEWNIAI